MTKTELATTKALVNDILEDNIQARCSDNVLYVKVCERIGRANGIDINSMSMPTFMLCSHQLGFPAFETVRRTRQKLQEEFPELAAVEVIAVERQKNEMVFRDFVRR